MNTDSTTDFTEIQQIIKIALKNPFYKVER